MHGIGSCAQVKQGKHKNEETNHSSGGSCLQCVGVQLVKHRCQHNWCYIQLPGQQQKLYSESVAYTAYLICAGDTTQADLLTALRKGDALSDYAIGGNSTTTLNSSSKIAKTSDFDYGSAGNSYDFYFAILDAANDQVLISDVSAGLAQESGTTAVSFSDSKTWSNQAFGDATYSAAGWYSTVPEPTSGLLLLLGMAGLALRRKQK